MPIRFGVPSTIRSIKDATGLGTVFSLPTIMVGLTGRARMGPRRAGYVQYRCLHFTARNAISGRAALCG